MASKRERVFASIGAILFFVTSFSLTFLVLWTMHQQHQQQSQQAKAQTTTCAATKPSAKNVNFKEKGVTLQGTSLTDFTPCTVDKLKTIDITTGTGPEAKPTDTVTVDYTGAVTLTGLIFQSSLDSGQPATFPLNQVIQGWTLGIPGMKVGGKRRLLIPAAQAYGANPPQSSGIPANADLVFDVTMINIGK
jgi:FKBP-type peptidyl-prolyl cis-trans isomerase FkpA